MNASFKYACSRGSFAKIWHGKVGRRGTRIDSERIAWTPGWTRVASFSANQLSPTAVALSPAHRDVWRSKMSETEHARARRTDPGVRDSPRRAARMRRRVTRSPGETGVEGKWVGEHGIVLGASVSGLLAARVLADSYRRVTIVERDGLPA